MTYIVGISVFTGVVFLLVTILLFIEAKVVTKGDCRILINKDEEKSLTVSSGSTLLASLVNNAIFLPSACGGGGSCGLCRCKVDKGGGDFLPTELPHLSRMDKKENIRLACQVKVRENMQIRIPPEIFSIQKYNAVVVSNDNVATFIKELALSLDPGQELEFQAGAYMQIDIPEYEVAFSKFDVADRFNAAWEKFELRKLEASSEEPVYRAYSLASPPYEKELLKFTIRLATPPADHPDAPPGVGSSYVFSLKPGDKITLSGPYGDFFVKDTEREMCFIGGGAGMAPMRCHILHQLNTVQTKRKMTFWYGARSRQEMFYDDEFQALDRKFDNFAYHVALSDAQPEDNWTGMTGFIHQCLFDSYLKGHPDPTEIEYYLCGPPMMINAVMKMLDSLGVEPEMIAFDDFG
ncbi:MAG: NADH:ubiquinone reductase (Na(+)-transporting) subunit F [Desulfobacteraceae bacterium]|nr:MAG: NADH:ubiquinone reductase (Na(+)-transporting) subunit F [Desulfobacteraceae bacterium]